MQDETSIIDLITPVKKKRAVEHRTKDSLPPVVSTPVSSVEKLKKVIPPSPFMKRLGYGTGVNVYLMERSPLFSGNYRSPWAVKKINSKLKVDSSLYEERMATEARLLAKINHPNIIGFRGISKNSSGEFCLCLENGERSLMDEIGQRKERALGAFPLEAIEQVLFSVAKALSCLHNEHHILHGDVKSANILLRGNGYDEVKLCDFGVAVELTADLSAVDAKEEYVGTGPWTCQEALLGLPVSHKADIYALGCVLYEMLTLAVPHMPPHDDSFADSDAETDDSFCFEDLFGTTPVLDVESFDVKYKNLIELMMVCTSENPDLRPSAAFLVEALAVPTNKE